MATVGDDSIPESFMTDTRAEDTGANLISVAVVHISERGLGY